MPGARWPLTQMAPSPAVGLSASLEGDGAWGIEEIGDSSWECSGTPKRYGMKVSAGFIPFLVRLGWHLSPCAGCDVPTSARNQATQPSMAKSNRLASLH